MFSSQLLQYSLANTRPLFHAITRVIFNLNLDGISQSNQILPSLTCNLNVLNFSTGKQCIPSPGASMPWPANPRPRATKPPRNEKYGRGTGPVAPCAGEQVVNVTIKKFHFCPRQDDIFKLAYLSSVGLYYSGENLVHKIILKNHKKISKVYILEGNIICGLWCSRYMYI